MTKESLTQERLKEVLNYNAETGLFTWKQRLANRITIGGAAGGISRGYIVIRIDNNLYLSHRLAFLYMKGKLPENDVDHINHIRIDNRWFNLRESTSKDNNMNKSISEKNTSGVTGVYWHRKCNKWCSQIKIDRVSVHLGSFIEKLDAICARKSAENKYGFHPNHGN